MYQNTKQHGLQSLLNSKVSNMQVTGRMFETNWSWKDKWNLSTRSVL